MKKTWFCLLFATVTITGTAATPPKAYRGAAPDMEFVSRADFEKNFAVYRTRSAANAAPRTPPAMKIEHTETFPGYIRHLVSYQTEPEERVEGYLLIPADLKPGEKRPLVLTLHGTNIYGKDAPVNDYRAYPAPVKAAEQESRRQRAFAEELVRRGFICFAPDRPGYGKRCPDQPATGVPGQRRYIRELAQRHPGWGYNGGKVLHDLQQALDFLDKLDYVDAARIGTIGHSLGGHDSLYLAAFDPRIAAVVASCPGNMQFQPHLWQSADALAQLCQTAPLGNGALTLNLVLQAIAPRPMMLLHAWNDYLHRPSSSIIEAQITIWSYYVKQLGGDAAFKQKSPFSLLFHSCGHAVPDQARFAAYAFLQEQLMPPSR
ncbi:MAG: alpha/beta fold hydrolase [Lentisphaeria bacterium]|nr:alpha/beta fold hydrolase [Lentisphaeria bacterium]